MTLHSSIQQLALSPYATDILKVLSVLSVELPAGRIVTCLLALWSRQGMTRRRRPRVEEIAPALDELLEHHLLIYQRSTRYQISPRAQGLMVRSLYQSGELERVIDATKNEVREDALRFRFRDYDYHASLEEVSRPCQLQLALLKGEYTAERLRELREPEARYEYNKGDLKRALSVLVSGPYDEQWRTSLSTEALTIGLELQSLTSAQMLEDHEQVKALLSLHEEGVLTPPLISRLRRFSSMSGDDYGLDWSLIDARATSPDALLVRSWAELMKSGVTQEVINRYRERLQQWRKLNRKRTAIPNQLEVLWLTLAELTSATPDDLKALLKPLKTLSEQDGDHKRERVLLYQIVSWKLGQRGRPELHAEHDDPIALSFQLIALKWFDLKFDKHQDLLSHIKCLCSSELSRLALEACSVVSSMKLVSKRDLKEVKTLIINLRARLGDAQTLSDSYEPLPLWREQLLNIELLCSSGGETSSPVKRSHSKDRLAWIIYIYRDGFDVECRHQVKKADGWSKGRKIALKRLAGQVDSFPFLTRQDQEICSHIKRTVSGYGWNTITSYDLAISGLVPMINHPVVFYSEKRRRLKVERGVPSVEIEVGKVKDGQPQTWCLDFVPFLERSEPIAYEIRGSRLLVYELTPAQRALCTSGEQIEVPLQGLSALRATLSKVSAHFTVHSALPLSSDQPEEISEGDASDFNSSLNQTPPSTHTAQTDEQRAMRGELEPEVTSESKKTIHREFDPTFILRLKREGDQLIVSDHLIIPNSSLELTPGVGLPLVTVTSEEAQIVYQRDITLERARLEDLNSVLSLHADQRDEGWVTEGIEQSFNLLLALQSRDELIEWPEGESLKVKPLARDRKLSFNISPGAQRSWFKLEGSLNIEEDAVLDLTELLRDLRTHNARFVRLTDDQLITLTEEMSAQLRSLDALLLDDGGAKLRAHSALANHLSPLTQELSGGEVKSPDRWLKLAERSREAHAKKRNKPRHFKADFRPYQRVGFEWLSALMDVGLGACLADDMGLGKTVQVIALLCQRRAAGASLVVAPTSLLNHWRSEIERFAPELSPTVFNDASDRSATIKSMRAQRGAKKVLITSYGLLVQSQELFTSLRWNIAVFDEAQALKNPETKRYQAASQLKSKGRIALSGTPIENRLSELWSIFSLLIPRLLGDRALFKERFENPIEGESGDPAKAKVALRALTHPFILRRLKSDVLSDLPAKTEQTLKLRPSAEETALYEALRREALRELDEARADGKVGHIEVLARLTRLRLAACHPELLRAHFSESPELIERLDQLSISAKHHALRKLVRGLREGGHRALIFSQFVSHLTLIRGWLDEEGINYQYLDGSTQAHLRAERVASFQAGEGEVFLISLRAGGVGLNLTAADYVIHMDPWWNPAVEDQATDRAHRIGQTNPVTVYRLITEGTVEEKILALHEQKRSLAEGLLEGSDTVKRLDLETLIAML